MKESRRGYKLPYAVDTGTRIGIISVTAVCAVLYTVLFWFLLRPETLTDWAVTLVPALLMVVFLTLPEVADLFAVLHIVPEGIAITLFGKTARRFPAEQIRFLTAISGNASSNHTDKIAVCDQTLEELTALGYKTTPKVMRIPKPRWSGEFAESYLYHRSMTIPGELNFMRKILWLDWSPERLAILQEMYPEALWLDCTRDQRFEKQLNP